MPTTAMNTCACKQLFSTWPHRWERAHTHAQTHAHTYTHTHTHTHVHIHTPSYTFAQSQQLRVGNRQEEVKGAMLVVVGMWVWAWVLGV